MRSPTPLWPRLAAGLVALLLASCVSGDRPHRGAPPKPPTPVAGEGSFFTGQLVASIHVGMEFPRPDGGGDGAGPRANPEGRSGRPGGGGGMSFGGGGPMHLDGGGGGHGGGGKRGERGERSERGNGGPRMMPANGVPLTIHLRLRNTGSAPVEVAVPTFSSPLGNFVVQPATLTIPAGGSAEVTPMTAFVQGDLPDEMPATLALRTADGRAEKQVVTLRPMPRETPPAAER